MLVVLRPGAPEDQIAALTRQVQALGGAVQAVGAGQSTVWRLENPGPDLEELLARSGLAWSLPEGPEEPARWSRQAHPASTTVEFGGAGLGGGRFCLMAGPCAVESAQQLFTAARMVQAAGAQALRGGAFKPRTSPYTFQGLGEEGLRLLLEAKRRTGLPVVTEIPSVKELERFADVDLIQVGARNMQNFELLRELGRGDKPVLLKRGPANTLEELLWSAERLLAGGNGQVILCERGIRAFDPAVRYTLDLSAVPLLHERTHLPVVVDPSHGTGRASLAPAMAVAAAAAGADGLLLEVHPDPAKALCDGAQSLTPLAFAQTAEQVRRVRAALFPPEGGPEAPHA